MSVFKKNIEAILGNESYLATKLLAIKENEKFEVFLDEKEPLNINIIDKSSFTPLYKTTPLQEIEVRYKELSNIKRHPYLYFFGMGNGVLYKMLLQNEQHKRILIYEPEIEVLYIVLNLIDFSQEIKDGKLVIVDDLIFSNVVEYFTSNDIKIYSKIYDLQINCNFYENYHKEMLEVNKAFLKAIYHVVFSIGNDSIDSLIGLEHHFMNIDKMIKTPTLAELVRKAKVTNSAILVSTGPSLTKQLPLLKKIQENVVIVCVDASFPILYQNGIKPDIVVSMERVPDTGEFFKQTPKEAHEGIVFALSSLQHPDIINGIKAGTKQISMRPFGYTQVLKSVSDWGYIGIGMSAANMAYELIYHSKFKQCVLIGQDLAYAEDGKLSHAKGHILGEDEVKEKPTDTYVTKYGGNGKIKTTMVWDSFRNYFEVDIKVANESMLTINATEGGARIAGATELTFAEVVDKYVDTNKVKEKIILENISEKKYLQVKENLDKEVASLKKYAMQKAKIVNKTFLEVAKFCDELEKIDLEKDLDKVDFKKAEKLNEKIEKVKDFFNARKFNMIFFDSLQAFILHQEMELVKIVIRDVTNDKDRKIKLLDWIKNHKFWLFSLAGCMDATLVGINRKGSFYDDENSNINLFDYAEKRKSLEIDLNNFISGEIKSINL